MQLLFSFSVRSFEHHSRSAAFRSPSFSFRRPSPAQPSPGEPTPAQLIPAQRSPARNGPRSYSALVQILPLRPRSRPALVLGNSRSRTRAVLAQPNNVLVQLDTVLALAQIPLVLARSCSQPTLVQLNNALVQLLVCQQSPETSFPHGHAEARDFGLGLWSL